MMESKTDLTLVELDEAFMDRILQLRVRDEQKRFVPSAGGIVARAWVHRAEGAQLWVLQAAGRPVGLALVYEVTEDPACYYLMELMVDQGEQGKGYGTAAVRELVDRYAQNPAYPMLEVSVDRENLPARRVYEKAGFVDEGYVDPDLPQYVNLVYRFS